MNRQQEDIHYTGDFHAAWNYKLPRLLACAPWLALALFVGLLLLSCWLQLDEVVHTRGQVVGQPTQLIQNLEGGLIAQINVQEGQEVAQGEIVAVLENTDVLAAYRDNFGRLVENTLALLRLEAQRNGASPAWPKELDVYLMHKTGRIPDAEDMRRAEEILADQRQVFQAQETAREQELQVLQAQVELKEAELEEQRKRLEQIQAMLPFTRERRDTAKTLSQRRNFSKMNYLDLEAALAAQEGQAKELEISLGRFQAAVDEVHKRIEAKKVERALAIAEEINQRGLTQMSLLELIRRVGNQVGRTEIPSPVRGIVRQTYLNTIGGVVRPGDIIMDITPLANELSVEAQIAPQDIGFVAPGQPAEVRLTAYDAARYGSIAGELESVSADTVNGYYIATVRLNGPFKYRGEVLEIAPGMIAEVDIVTGHKSLFSYVTKPILKSKQN